MCGQLFPGVVGPREKYKRTDMTVGRFLLYHFYLLCGVVGKKKPFQVITVPPIHSDVILATGAQNWAGHKGLSHG